MDVPGKTVRRARSLRKVMTLPEVVLWQVIRREALEGLKFRKQHPLGPYIIDFYCDEARRAVEVDGEAHTRGDRPKRDARRDEWLAGQGVRVLRFNAIDVLQNLDGVVRTILAEAPFSPLRPFGPLPPKGAD